MVKVKLILILSLLINTYASTQKVYFYNVDSSINNYRSLKIAFEEYLSKHGEYEFQAFSDRDSFEKKLEEDNAIAILSSWHYDDIFKYYDLGARYVAQKDKSIYISKVLIGQNSMELKGSLASCYDENYTKKTLDNIKNKQLSFIKVPKEIDALMSVGFGISNFAIVSKDSFEAFANTNRALSSKMKIIKEFTPTYKMVIAFKNYKDNSNKLFTLLENTKEGKKILELLNIDGFIPFENQSYKKLGGLK